MQQAIDPRRVLILYWTPQAPSMIRAAIRHHLEAIRQGPSLHRLTFWNAYEGTPALVRMGAYDAVILHTTLLCLRWFESFPTWRRRLSWIGKLDCLKLAMPQDEYDHSEILDEWLADLGVNHVFSTFLADVPLLYPVLSERAQFHAAFTGYIDESTAHELEGRPAPSIRRPFDVVYRASNLPYWFGSLGQLKHVIGVQAQAQADARGLKANISTRTEDAVLGSEWFAFLSAGRAVVGCESGSSVLDRRGEMQAAIRRYLSTHPAASFEEVAEHMPEGWDSHRFAAVSPRHFEAVITKTCQVLVEGRYDGVLVAGRHYVPVRRDLADLGDALESASDPHVASEMADRTYEEIYRSGRYAYRVLAELIDRVLETRPARGGAGGRLSSMAERWGARRLARPARRDASWTVAVSGRAGEPPTNATPWLQMIRVLARPSGWRLLIGCGRGRSGRRLLRVYLGTGAAARSISAARLLAEGDLLERLARAQGAQPRTPAFRAVKATTEGGALELWVLSTAANDDPYDLQEAVWPPRSIAIREPSYRDLVRDDEDGEPAPGSRLDAVVALAEIRPLAVQAALRPFLDGVGGARSRPRVSGLGNRIKSAVAIGRILLGNPSNLWLLATAVGRAPVQDTADDLVKIALAEAMARREEVTARLDPRTNTLRLVTGEAGAHGRNTQKLDAAGIKRIIWDNSQVSGYVYAPVALGRRTAFFLGGGGVHEFTAIEALPPTSRERILRRFYS